MTDESVIRDRLSLLPPIRRARLWRLYAEERGPDKPWRFLDLWMDDGRSLLGAKGVGLGTIAKAAIDIGLTKPFPSVREARLEKALLARYPGFAAARFYRNEERAARAAEALAPGTAVPLLRPFAEYFEGAPESGSGPASAPRIAAPRLPCPSALAPGVLLFRDTSDAVAAAGDLVPPLQLACAHGALLEFERFERSYDEKLWRKTDRRLRRFFERRGPYLRPRVAAADYGRFFSAALGAGVLVSPAFELPSIIPGDFDDGELAALAAALATAFGELA
jgi:hypothetical protein